MVQLLVRVRDVNGREYAPAFFAVRYMGKQPDGTVAQIHFRLIPGVATDFPVADDIFKLSVGTGEPAFTGESFTLMKSGSRWLTDTPAATVSMQGNVVQVDVVDGTIRLAPTVYLEPERLIADNPNAILCEPGQGWIYRTAWLNNPPIDLLKPPIRFTDSQPDDLPYVRHPQVTEEGKGNLVFLEYGCDPATPPGRNPRFLIGAWAPRVALGSSPQVLLFYSPPTKPDKYPADTYPFRGAYPYSPFLTLPHAPAPAGSLTPAYPNLAVDYLLGGYKIVPQLLAAGRNPIIICPINPSGNWGPLTTRSGICRLIKEVLRFLYARQIVSGRTAPVARLSLAEGRASILPPAGLFTEEPIPRSWALTASGFSNGIDRVLDLCGTGRFDDQLYDPAVFASPEATLLESWREIWDVDGVADDGKGADRHLKSLQQWLTSERRRVRSYHSDHGMRTAPRSLVEAARMVSTPSPPYKGIAVEEGTSANDKVTWVHFSDASLKKNPHHTVPRYAFGHAAHFPMP